jgi:ceramide glucosyltransferase
MLVIELVLLVWTVVAFTWWVVSYCLIGDDSFSRSPEDPPEGLPTVTVFKSLPPTAGANERLRLAAAVESFMAQVEPRSQLIIGIEEGNVPAWKPILDRWSDRVEDCHLVIRALSPPLPSTNPKISKFEALAPFATGECWLWSDADVFAPEGMLDRLRRELADSAIGAVTTAYVVRAPERLPGMLDALFVNLEFLPGVLLLGQRGLLNFAFGAAIMFRASDFHARVSWSDLLPVLADDYELGQRLGRVRLSSCRVETLALSTRWRQSLRHYYRWQKTIRWCRPGGYLALVTILPLLGWLLAVAAWPSAPQLWTGLGCVWMLEAVVAGVLFRKLDCRLPARGWLLYLAWPPLRALTWLAVWLPFSVGWGEGSKPWRKGRRSAGDTAPAEGN